MAVALLRIQLRNFPSACLAVRIIATLALEDCDAASAVEDAEAVLAVVAVEVGVPVRIDER